jgi:hypothetical protein
MASKAQLAAKRDEIALAELTEIGWKVNVNEPGCCVLVIVSRDGRRKLVTGSSVLDAHTQATSWWNWQTKSLKPDAPERFIVASPEEEAHPVIHRPAGDTAETAARRERTIRRVIQLEGDAHGNTFPGAPTRVLSEHRA